VPPNIWRYRRPVALTDVVINGLQWNLMYGDKKFPNPEKFKYTWINTEVYSLKRRGIWKHHLPEHGANVWCPNVCYVFQSIMLFRGIVAVYCESRTEHKTQAVVKDLGCDLFFPHPAIHYPVIPYLSLYPILSHWRPLQINRKQMRIKIKS